jgi:hypothetical protein
VSRLRAARRPCARSAWGSSEPTGSSGEMACSVMARPKSSEVTDFPIDQLSKVWLRFTAAARSSPTRQP